jgi:hypothetical protein
MRDFRALKHELSVQDPLEDGPSGYGGRCRERRLGIPFADQRFQAVQRGISSSVHPHAFRWELTEGCSRGGGRVY